MSSACEEENPVRWYKADLHIHTVLSPCADLSMGPKNIVEASLQHGIELIAITDHNSCDNVQAVYDVGQKEGLTVIPGMEVYTREEAHMICLFETIKADLAFQEIIYEHLPDGDNDIDWYGHQYIVDAKEHILGECPRLLGMPTNLPVQDVLQAVNRLGGCVFPAHIDRKANSLLRVLGFIPNNWPIHAVEIHNDFDTAVQEHRFLKNTPYSIIRSSDAHFIEQIGQKHTWFKLEEPTFRQVHLALKKQGGREISLSPEPE